MSKDEGYSEPLDSWGTTADEISSNEQQITSNQKGKFSAFGDTVVSSGRAEWDLQIDLESYGGICIGIYKHSKLSKKDDVSELPTNENFSKTENGWGYTNKTGAIIHNGERKKYGIRYRTNDTLTMSLDLLACTLTYSINGESQGLAYDIPRGAYRLACCVPFQGQQVSIKRFWTSLPRSNGDTNNGTTNETTNETTNGSSDDVSNSEPKSETSNNESNNDSKESENATDNNVQLPTIITNNTDNENDNSNQSLDDNNTDENYDFDKNDQSPTTEESREVSKSLKKMAKSQSQDGSNAKEKGGSESLEIIGGGVSRVRGGSLSANVSVETDSKNESEDAPKSKVKNGNKAPEPINVSVKDDEESTDYFNVSGTNLSTEKPNVLSCIREQKGVPHSGYGATLVTHGRTEWILKVITGHHIIIGVSATTSHSDELFTKYPFGFGYCDDGNIYTKSGYIEYNNGFKSGDTVGVHLDMESGELRFSVNKVDQGPAFSGLNKYLAESKSNDNNSNENDDIIDGYRLAVSLQYRPHSVQLLESTSWSTKRISPRPDSNDIIPQWSFVVPHQRKLSWMSSSKKSIINEKDEITDNNENNNNNNTSNSDNSDNSNNGNDNNSGNNENDQSNDSENNSSSKKGSKTGKKTSSTLDVTVKTGDDSNGNKSDGKKKRPKSARKAPKSPRTKTGGKKTKTSNDTNSINHNKTLQPSQYRKNASNDSNANWTLRNGSTDIWERSGSKLEVTASKNSVSAKHDIKDGNSAIGKLVVSNNMKVQWDIRIDQGSRVTIGIMNMDGKSQTAMRKLLNSFFTNDLYGYGYFGNDGGIARNGRFKKYGEPYKRGDTVSVILDLFNKTLKFSKNNEDQGVAFKNIPFGEYRVAITIPKNRHKITLQKVQIWDALPPNANNNDTDAVMSTS